MSSGKLIKNTIVLYVRMVFSLAVSLYSARLVLNALGVVDYGVYNVVASIVTITAFVSSALNTGTQRFINYELGTGEPDGVQKVFSTAFKIHLLIAFALVVIIECAGVWFLNSYLVIPKDRIHAANWILQFSIVSVASSLIQVPFLAMIIAHEKMSVFARIDIAQSFLKLFAASLLFYISTERLFAYGAFTMLIAVVVLIVYVIYNVRNFQISFSLSLDHSSLFKRLLSFSGWNLIGNFAVSMSNQGQAFLINMFFGPALNAAQSVAMQLNNGTSALVYNFQIALNPKIIQSYASGKMDDFHQLIEKGAKLSFFLTLIIAAPVLIETEKILKVWLGLVPSLSVEITRFVVISSLLNSVSLPLITAVQASGKIVKYHLVIGFVVLLNLPIAYIFLKLGYSAISIFVVAFVVQIVAVCARLILLCELVNVQISSMLNHVFMPILKTSILCLIILLIISKYMPNTIVGFALNIVATLIICVCSIYVFGLDRYEKSYVSEKSRSFLRNLKSWKRKKVIV